MSALPNQKSLQEQSLGISSKSAQPEAAKNTYRWNQKNYSTLARRIDIWRFVLSLLFRWWRNRQKWTYVGGYTEEKRAVRRKLQAIWLREGLLELGPTFIKLGQLFSTRADLFPKEYVDELSKLQDSVPAFDYDQVVEIISTDLGKPVPQLFKRLDPIPLAAASLGQVHQAQLHSGEEVVVKIQRPGLKQLFTIDLVILKRIAQYFQNHPEWGKGRDWLGIYDECCRILWQETDYLREGRNADMFRRNFREYDWVKVPKVYWRYTSPRVVTLEYVPGIKISHYEAIEAAGLDRRVLARQGAEAYLHQLLNSGFFHADPHPGNLAVTPSGSLIFYDFGMMGEIKSNVREGLMETLYGITQKNADRVVASLIKLGALAPTGDMGPVRRSVQYMLDHFMDKPFEEQSVAAISEDLYDITYDQPFRFPATFTFVMRAFTTLEGVGKGLDPNFNFMEVAQPFALDIMTNSSSSNGNSILDELGRQAAQVGTTALSLPRRIDDTIEKLERGDIRVRMRSIELERVLRRLSAVQIGTNYTMILCAVIISATLLAINELIVAALVVGGFGLFLAIALLRLLRKLDRIDRMF